MIKDETIKLARFSTFKSDCEEDEKNYTLAKRALEDYLNDVRFNLILVGKVGAELGDMDAADSKATAFVNRVLFKVFDGRQGKKTIITTNLTGEAVIKAYDERITSRMFNTYRHIEFKFTRDKRKRKLPF
ncbi:hypothetical protein AT257_06710 [Bacillus cereus]|nr:hypothetical protein AT257_06710 [Bacillus cereus]